MRILDAEEGSQGTRVGATEGDDGRLVGLVFIAHVEDEFSRISQSLLRRQPLQVIGAQVRSGLRATIVTVLNTNLQCAVSLSEDTHLHRSHNAAVFRSFTSQLQKDGSTGRRTTPVRLFNPVTLRPGTVVLVVVVIESLVVNQLLGREFLDRYTKTAFTRLSASIIEN